MDNYIQDGIPDPTASPGPSSSYFPTSSWYPTESPTPTSSPWPTTSLFPTTDESTAILGDDNESSDSQTAVAASSVGHGQSCNGFVLQSSKHIQEELIFTYIAESTISSPDFLTELELHLIDHAVAQALQCSSSSSSCTSINYAIPPTRQRLMSRLVLRRTSYRKRVGCCKPKCCSRRIDRRKQKRGIQCCKRFNRD